MAPSRFHFCRLCYGSLLLSRARQLRTKPRTWRSSNTQWEGPPSQLSPLQDFPGALNPCSLANRRCFSWFPLVSSGFLVEFQLLVSPWLCSSASGANPWHKPGRRKKREWEASSYRVFFRVLSLLHNLSACVYFSEFLGISFFAFGPELFSCRPQQKWAWVVLFHLGWNQKFPRLLLQILSSTALHTTRHALAFLLLALPKRPSLFPQQAIVLALPSA